MDPQFLVNLCVAIALLIVIVFGLRALAPTIAGHFRAGSQGWAALSKVYATSAEPGPMMSQQTVMVGPVVYRRSVNIALSAAGLYLERGFPLSVLGKTPLLIPWADIKRVAEGRLFWEKAPCLEVGDPPIGAVIVRPLLFEKMKPWLAQTGVGGSP